MTTPDAGGLGTVSDAVGSLLGAADRLLPGSIQDAPNGAHGIDTSGVIRPDAASAFVRDGFTFAVRYVSRHEAGQSGDLSIGEAEHILGAGLALMLVQHVPLAPWRPTPELGTQYGKTAAAHATRLGYGRSGSLFVDLEGVAARTAPTDVIAYVTNWAEAVSRRGFSPGLYVGFDPILDGDQLAALPVRNYWRAAGHVPVLGSGKSYQMKQSFPGELHGLPVDKDVTQHQTSANTLRWQKT